ncbi:MAG: mitochondrial carrier domain-containing protein [Benniella sp.]|nr:MAG: mitochondrial carrier domain-containing protein [Benniella sp.]
MQPKKKKAAVSEQGHGADNSDSCSSQQDSKDVASLTTTPEVAEATASSDSHIGSSSDPSFVPLESSNQQSLDHQQLQHPPQAAQKGLQEDTERLEEDRVSCSSDGNSPRTRYETREERQIRIRKQFNQLDQKRSGFLDTNSLVGFFAEVTPDKNVQRRYADELLQLYIDDQHNGHVRYDDFEVFLEEKEERLWNLFREIDYNNDNEIQPEELQASLAKAGINLSDADLRRFIKAMDKDGDGMIDFEEWRDFLVLLPRETTLKEIFHYVQEVVAQVGVDGDVVMPPSENDYVARYLLAGAIAGAVSRTATAPLDRLKVYLITNSMPTLTVRQRLLWNAVTDLYHQGGVRTFFRGNGLNIIKIAPESAIKFYTYETSKSFIVHHTDIATSGRFLAGGIAGLVSQFSIYPLETIKTRIMSSTGGSHGGQTSSSSAMAGAGAKRLSMRLVVREIWQKAGLRGFYRGLGPSLVGIFPYAAIDLSVFETLKFGYMRWKAGVHEGDEGSEEKSLERPSVFVLLACGTISGSVGATSVYPLSLVRTRLQAQGTPQHPQTYTSTLDVFRKTFEKEGIRGFYKGMVPTLTKVVPAVSISYVVYEYSKRELGL